MAKTKPKSVTYFVLILNTVTFLFLYILLLSVSAQNSSGELGGFGATSYLGILLFIPIWVASIISYYFLEKKLRLAKSNIYFLPLIFLAFPTISFLTAMSFSVMATRVNTYKTSVSATKISQEDAALKVSALPEVKQFFSTVKTGKLVLDHEDSTSNAWIIHIYEDLPDHIATFAWYSVNENTGEIIKL
jgi:hypothetical protein